MKACILFPPLEHYGVLPVDFTTSWADVLWPSLRLVRVYSSKLPLSKYFRGSSCLKRQNGNPWWTGKALPSQATHHLLFHLCLHLPVPKVACGPLWPLRVSHSFTTPHLCSCCLSLCNTRTHIFAQETPMHSAKLSPNVTSSFGAPTGIIFPKQDGSELYYS